MAVTEAHVEAPPERCFDVLRDPRAFSYWVVGSDEIRSFDTAWPAVGSRFDHRAGMWPLAVKDRTVVEEVEPNRRLRLRARARPFGTAFVTLTLRPEGKGSLLCLEEEPADRLSRLLFNPLADRLLQARNVVSVERFKELAEGRVSVPSGESGTHPAGRQGSAASDERVAGPAAGFGRGFLAGLAGGVAMSASTFADMRLTGRGPSSVPAQAIERLFRIEELGATGERRMTATAHFLVSAAAGGAWGAIASGRLGRSARASLLFGLAVLPDVAIVPAMGLARAPWRWSPADMGRTAVHHGVFAAVTYQAFSRLEG